jgi:hypothetical protein
LVNSGHFRALVTYDDIEGTNLAFITNYSTMKKNAILVLSCIITISVNAQSSNREQIERACRDYIEGFYEGDTTKLIRSLKPTLYKFGYWRDKKTGVYAEDGQMTYKQAVSYAKNVQAKKNFAKAEAPRKVDILDAMDQIAAAKVTAWWGVDYILLSKRDDKWIIEQVLWEGPLETIAK